MHMIVPAGRSSTEPSSLFSKDSSVVGVGAFSDGTPLADDGVSTAFLYTDDFSNVLVKLHDASSLDDDNAFSVTAFLLFGFFSALEVDDLFLLVGGASTGGASTGTLTSALSSGSSSPTVFDDAIV